MKINKINSAIFSPTGGTRQVVTTIAQNLGNVEKTIIDLTFSGNTANIVCKDTELTIFGIPVYGGRVPEVAAQRLLAITGNNSPAVVVAVYGNRAFDDALLELKNIVEKQGFIVIAGAAFIGEHSFSDASHPIASGRPDARDIEAANHFAQEIQEKITSFSTLSDNITPKIPGNTPHKALMQPNTISPITDNNLCTRCGKCVEVCPTGAITLNGKIETDGAKCILCCACVKVCADNARIAEDKLFTMATEKLFANCKERKESEFFL